MAEFTKHLEHNDSAAIVDGVVVDFGDPAGEFQLAETGPTKCPLLSFGIVSISGSDARAFTNAQFTTDCNDLTPLRGQLSAWCDPKGRVLFLFTLFTDGERIFTLLPKALIPAFLRRLQMYVLRADVTLQDASADYSLIGLTGDKVPDGFDAASLQQAWDTACNPPAPAAIRHGPGGPRFIVVVAANETPAYWQALDYPAVGEPTWTARDCRDGVPRIDEQTSGEYLPQNLNLDFLNALSFSKGCYPGQEIVARVKYRGKVKKRLVAATLATGAAPAPLTPIRGKDNERPLGHVLVAQRIADGSCALSAVIETTAVHETLFVDGVADKPLCLQKLPYASE